MDFSDLPKFQHYVIIAIVVICLGELFDWLYSHAKRKKDACHQKEVYHQKLEHDSLAIKSKRLKEELQLVKRIGDLLDEFSRLEEQLKGGYNELGDLSLEDKLADLTRELARLRDKANELEAINREICQEKKKLLKEQDGANDFEPSLHVLMDNIDRLEADNQRLESQLANHKLTLTKNSV